MFTFLLFSKKYNYSYIRSWQYLYFPARVVRYFRIVGTHNTVNKVNKYSMLRIRIPWIRNILASYIRIRSEKKYGSGSTPKVQKL